MINAMPAARMIRFGAWCPRRDPANMDHDADGHGARLITISTAGRCRTMNNVDDINQLIICHEFR